MKYTPNCTEDCELILEPVPGAAQWPKRLICETHGYPTERHSSFSAPKQAELEKPNNYTHEVASPADIVEVAGNEVSLY